MTQIKLRRDTSTNFASKNPVLGAGEPAYETDTKKLKIGDGTTAYNSLTYFAGDSSTFEVVQPLKLVDGTLTLQIDEQTIQVQDGKLVANLGELGDEVNTLAGDVAGVQADILKKQNKLVSASPIEIKESTGLTVVGTPMSGNDFVMDSISDTSYCLFPEKYIGIGNEYQIKFTTPSVKPTTYERVFDFGDPLCPQWDYETDNLSVWVEPQGWQPIISNAALNATYYLKMKMTGTLQMQYCYSTDGIIFTDWTSVNLNSSNPWNPTGHSLIGVGANVAQATTIAPWSGTVDLKECYVIKEGIKCYMFPDANTGAIGLDLGSGLSVVGGKLTATGGGGSTSAEKYGLEGDYCSKYGIVDCPNGILEEDAGKVTLKAGVVMQLTETDGLTTNASDMVHDITSTVDFDLFYTSGSLLESTKVVFSEQEPEDGATGVLAWFNGLQWQFKSNDTGNVWRAAPAVRLAHFLITDGNITRIDYIGNRHLNKVIPVTVDTVQTITASKTFGGIITLKSASIGNQVSALQIPLYVSGTTLKLVPIVQSYTDLDNPISELRFGSVSNKLKLRGSEIVDKNNKKFLTQGNITGTDNITATETTDGIQVAGLSNSAIAALAGMTNNMTVYNDVVSGTEYVTTEAGFWVTQGETLGPGYISIDLKDSAGNWTVISGINAPSSAWYLVSATPFVAAGEAIRVRHGNLSSLRLIFCKTKGGAQ